MLDGQVRPHDVTSLDLLQAIGDTPRELFVPEDRRALAYLDEDQPLLVGISPAKQRYLLKAMVLAKMIESLNLSSEEHVLIVGCNTGYSAALISPLAARVFALEENVALLNSARQNFIRLDHKNIETFEGRLVDGLKREAPYDAILIDGAVDNVPEGLSAQLKTGGRLIAVVGRGRSAKATLYTMSENALGKRVMFDASAPILPGFEKQEGFVF